MKHKPTVIKRQSGGVIVSPNYKKPIVRAASDSKIVANNITKVLAPAAIGLPLMKTWMKAGRDLKAMQKDPGAKLTKRGGIDARIKRQKAKRNK